MKFKRGFVMMKSQRLMFFATVSVACMTRGGAVWADPAPAAEGLEEVVVTAQKRAQNIQSVPISMIAVSGETRWPSPAW